MTDTNDQPRPVIGRIEQLTTREVDALCNDLAKELEAALARGPLVIDTMEKAAEWARNLVSSARWDTGFGERRVADANDQPGACAAVPLPEPVASRAPNALAVGQWVYREPESFLEKLCRISDAIAYGEACAAHRNAHLAKLCEDRTRMLQQAERERDEQRARAEAAEAKIAEMEGATPQRRA